MHLDQTSEARAAQRSWRRALELTAPIGNDPLLTLPAVIEAQAGKHAAAPALLAEGEVWTYQDLAARANRYARWALGQGLGRGDVVCLAMANAPDYLAIWLGITRIGAVVALLNANQRLDSLVRAIASVAPKHVVIGAGLPVDSASLAPLLPPGMQCWLHGHEADEGLLPRIDLAADAFAGTVVDPASYAPPSIADQALYIYTSGTTGLPKAARVSHRRLLLWSYWFAGLMQTGPGDRMYNCLPMYHSVGGVVAVGSALVGGGSVVLAPRFSASRFWDDVVAWDCTQFQYIGELCRYLVNSPPHPLETRHRLRLCCGNGLSADLWERFKERFRIPRVIEFYAATEGTVSLYNCEGRVGAIGRVPPYLAHRFPIALIRCDSETGEPVRDAEGRGIRCATGEVGEAIGRVRDDGGRFEGYSDPAASERKLLRDVFEVGDTWYRTSDLMRRDSSGYFYFVDRLGDTFRWKGENVSTTEVAATILACPGVIEAAVYGVPVPGAEGRAGMAAIVAASSFDLAILWRHLSECLPDYARPLFLRVCREIAATETLKPKKQDLAREGFDPALSDPLYFNDRRGGVFVALAPTLHRRIVGGKARL
jgi:fatty-acyl-CoA synthase